MAKNIFALTAGVVLTFCAGTALAEEAKVPSILDTMDVASYENLSSDEMAKTIGSIAFADAWANANATGPNWASAFTSTFTNTRTNSSGNSAQSRSYSSSTSF